ncbi:MAG: hypothetical protein IID31_12265, partial [Planctomycetes bacterium]|nr:hypothetical protein [Planctomycetota bacterium]
MISVYPSAQNVSAGTNIVVEIRVDNVASLAAYEFEIQYEPRLLTFVSVTNNSFLGSTGRNVTCLPPQLGLDTVRYGCVTFSPPPPDGPSGSGVLATITFSTSCAGSSPLAFTLAGLGDALGAGLPLQTQDGSATVTGGGVCPTPTVTPTPGPASPTPSPTPPATATSVGPPPTPVPQLCAGAAGSALCVLPVSQTAFTGGQVDIEIAVDNIFNLGAFQFDLVFDSVLLSPVSVTKAGLIGSTGRSVVCLPALQADRVTFACATLGTDPAGPNGSGILALVTLQADAAGFSTLTLENSLLADITSADILVAAEQGGDVTIADPPTPTNTLTPTDTFTPTETATVPSPTPPATPTPGPLPETVVRIDPDAQNVGEGDEVVIEVIIDAVTDMGAYDFTLAFDPSLLTFVEVTSGSFLGSSGGSVVCIGPTVNETLGTVGFGCFGTSATGVTGTGTLATVRFGTSCGGTSALTLANVSIANAVGGTIPSVAHNASVGVNGATSCSPSSTATVTPVPTATPTGPASSTVLRVDPSSQGVVEGVDVVVDIVVDNV